ncbi:MAG: signal peptidase I [Treponema sp.]|nr:signal peptidase I [Treponema sp.]
MITAFLLYPVRQNSVSMNPDIPDQSLIMVSPLSKSYERGDIVLVKARFENNEKNLKNVISNICTFFTANQISLNENENLPGTKNSLRRIVGLPGDTIYMRDYVLYIKAAGQKLFLTEFELAPKAYNVTFFSAPAGWDSSIGVKGSFDEIVLGENQYFVLGDNRKSTDDSRFWGALDSSDIEGKALFCYFPFNKFKIF